MAQQLKRWESPRREGRNHKGRGGSAKARQYKKRQQQLRKRLHSDKGQTVLANCQTDNKTAKLVVHQAKNTRIDREREATKPLFFCNLAA